jgi:hypothetical protein
MMENQTPSEKQTRAPKTVKAKKPYKDPSFRYEKVFETAALSCGKITGTGGICNSSRKVS